jgi:hypothetical protein
MPRVMPRFDRELFIQAQSASGIVRAGEIAHASGGPSVRREWSITKLEALYELAYLRVFAAWESYLEAIFYRSLCGYASTTGQETLINGTYFSNLAAAQSAVLGHQQYALWHNPQKVINRCRGYIRAGRQENTISSNLARLDHFASTRHRIVHDQADAKRKFDAAALQITGRTYPASRPGKFLRDLDTSISPPRRWLEVTITDLTTLTSQMV